MVGDHDHVGHAIPAPLGVNRCDGALLRPRSIQGYDIGPIGQSAKQTTGRNK